MSRQYCVLFYGANEPYSMELFKYLNEQPFDFFSVTGLAKVCVNKPSIKATLIKNGITKVPCVLIKYYNETQDHFEGDQIYTWIDNMAHQMGYGYEVQQQPQVTPTPTSVKVTSADGNIMDTAKALQKDREATVGMDEGTSTPPRNQPQVEFNI